MAPITGSHSRLLSALGLIAGVAVLSIVVPRLNSITSLSASSTTVSVATTRPDPQAIVPPTNLPPTEMAAVPTLPPTAIALPTVAENNVTAIPTLTAIPTIAPQPTERPPSQDPTASPPSLPSIQPATQSQSNVGDLRLAVVSTHYEQAAMPSEGCDKVNSQRIGRRFDIRIAITNNTEQDLQATTWGAAAYSNKQLAKLCYFEGKGTLPPLVAKHTITLTLSAFVESNQNIDTLLVGTSTGKIARLCFSNGLAKLCSR